MLTSSSEDITSIGAGEEERMIGGSSEDDGSSSTKGICAEAVRLVLSVMN
jgi:hypothetical protein